MIDSGRPLCGLKQDSRWGVWTGEMVTATLGPVEELAELCLRSRGRNGFILSRERGTRWNIGRV